MRDLKVEFRGGGSRMREEYEGKMVLLGRECG